MTWVWEKMDAAIDSDPRFACCHPHEAAALTIYLFILRRGRLDGHPGKVKPRSMETTYLARMLYLSADVIDAAVIGLLRQGLIVIHRDGGAVNNPSLAALTPRNVTLRNVTEGITEAVTEAVTDSDYIQVSGWEAYNLKPSIEGPRSGASVRQARYRKNQQDLARIGKKATRSGERNAARDVTREPTREAIRSVTPSRNGREIREDIRSEDQISLVPGFPGTIDSQEKPTDLISEDQQAKKARSKADRVPDRCYRAADYLRWMVLDRNPEAGIGRRPWDGTRRPPNVYKPEPPDPLKKQGNRLKWADTIRLIVEVDGKSYEHIWGVIKWLWKEQPASLGTGFIVESPDTLREKWGAICMHMAGRAKNPAPTDPGGVDRAVAKLEEVMAKMSSDGGDA